MNKTGVNRNTKRQPHWNGKNPAQIPDAAPRSRTALDPVAYDNLIKQHGVRVKVYRSMYCPNVKSVDGGEHNIDCTLCNGSGFLDVDPIESVAYLANQNFQEEMTVEGYHDGNSVGGTFLGGVELQYFTRVDLMDFTQPFYERVLRRADSTKGSAGTPAVNGVIGRLEFAYTAATPVTASIAIFRNALPGGYFNIISDGTTRPVDLVLGDFNIGSPVNVVEHHTNEILIVPREGGTATEKAEDLVRLINGITTNSSGQQITPRPGGPVTVGAVLQRTCTASLNSAQNGVIITQDVGVTTNITVPTPAGDVTTNVVNGMALTPAMAASAGTNPDDNLKYDCRRVNVIIDKTGRQYHQDISFRLTPQGNVRWIGTDQPDAQTIYSVHYESVIQYRATSAMHVNRFAQVPDRSTGLVAQVKMPEQWMLQKEFLIIRRDEYGNEIQKTGIYGDIIANQPLNPAPADTL